MGQKVVNLTFHGIGTPPEHIEEKDQEFWLSKDFFHWILDRARERDDVRITFDDGNESDYLYGFPALIERGMTADFFVCVGRIGQPGYLSKPQIREMVERGMRFGSHGYHHRSWRGLPEKELEEEIVTAKRILEEIVGKPVLAASCPVGDYNQKVLQKLKEAGFEHVYTSDKGRSGQTDWLQSRNSLRRSFTERDVMDILESPSRSFLQAHRRIKTFLKRWR